MPWSFALVNNRLAEVYFDHNKNGDPFMRGHCYVNVEEYPTKKEQKWIEADTKKFQFSYRKGRYRDKQRGIQLKTLALDADDV